MRDAITGGTVYWLDDRMDAGPVAAQRWCFVDPEDDASSLWRNTLFPMGVDMLSSVVNDIARGLIVRQPQNEAFATFEPACNPPPVRSFSMLPFSPDRNHHRNVYAADMKLFTKWAVAPLLSLTANEATSSVNLPMDREGTEFGDSRPDTATGLSPVANRSGPTTWLE